MAERRSALKGWRQPGRFGEAGEVGVVLSEVRDLALFQIAAWPGTIDAVATRAAAAAGTGSAPMPCRAAVGSHGVLLRTEPLKWWLYGGKVDGLDPGEGAVLDLSHSRTHVRVGGPRAPLFLNRLIPLDLRRQFFGVGSVASTAMHHVGITLWRSDVGFELFLPRGFAVSLWEVMMDTAVQFGVEVTP